MIRISRESVAARDVSSVSRDHRQLQTAVASSLRTSGYFALGFVRCEARGDLIVLHGSVPTFHLKQVAQAIAQRTDGVWRVENCLTVERQAALPWPSRTEAGRPTT